MSVLRLTSKKTFPILLAILKEISFSQTQIAKTTNTSIGRVNKIVTWLKEKEIIVKETGKYVVTKPNTLTDLIADQQIIRKTRTYNITETKLKEKNLIFCLQSAIDKESEETHLIDTKETQAYLDTLPRGEKRIILYEYETITETMNTIRTIIDLKSIGEKSVAQTIAAQLWRTNQ